MAALILVTIALASIALQPPPQLAHATPAVRQAPRTQAVARTVRHVAAPDTRALMRIVVAREKHHARVVARRRARARAQALARQQARAAAAAQAVYSSATAWANSPDAIKVSNCESGGSRTATRYEGNVHDPYNPSYRGKWQMGYAEWANEGGSGDPAAASEAEQDYRAWKYWLQSGWRPWSCAYIMGVL